MALNLDKFITPQTESIANRLANVAGTALNVRSIDEALNKVGSLFKVSKTKDTGADTIIDDSIYKKIRENKERIPEKPAEAVEKEVAKTKIEALTYPNGLPHDFRLDIEFMDYKRPTPGAKATVERSLFVSLPLPRELIDQKQINYSMDELGLVGAVADSLYIAAGKSDGDVTGQAARAAVQGAPAVAGAAGAIAGRNMVGASLKGLGAIAAAGLLSDSVVATASQMTGAQMNPNLGVTFRGPTLGEHTFTWEFAPHSAEESRTLRKILTEIQARSLPSMTYANSTGILTYPQMCQVSLQPATFPMKKMVIRAVNINYAPNGAPSFFHGTKEPTVIAVTLQMAEIEYFLSEDFGGDSAKGLNEDISDIANELWDQFSEAMGLGEE